MACTKFATVMYVFFNGSEGHSGRVLVTRLKRIVLHVLIMVVYNCKTLMKP